MSLDKIGSQMSALKSQAMDFIEKKHPIVTGIAMMAIGTLLVAQGLGAFSLGSSLQDMGTWTNLGITVGIAVVGGLLYIWVKKGEKSDDPEVRKVCKTILTAMKIIFPTLIIGFLAVSMGLGSGFFTTDFSPTQILPFLGGFALAGFGAYSLSTGIVRHRTDKKIDAVLKDSNNNKLSRIKGHLNHRSNYNNFAYAMAFLACAVALGAVAYQGFNIWHHVGGAAPLSAGTVASVAAAACVIELIERAGNVLKGYQNPAEKKFNDDYAAYRLNQHKLKPTEVAVSDADNHPAEPTESKRSTGKKPDASEPVAEHKSDAEDINPPLPPAEAKRLPVNIATEPTVKKASIVSPLSDEDHRKLFESLD